MALVGTLLFCEDCGSLLYRHPPEQLLIKCDICFKQNSNNWPASQKTVSKPTAFPSRLRDKRSNVQILTAEDRDTWATTSKACPKCDHDKLKFRDVQTRGADEGSTIFYKCPACGHGFKEDN
ncbi:hypothetical protein D6C83_09032 [Aureobasidium pullulans]|uniref:DNA-directed RNA polymerase subunit n=1 Tax=Aureobasidium pullulans TaxID=5580 RepID=A0A4S9Z881_AURPU|nr:hypothetical protein D6C83_09032 [Aureobasidium pullulans]